MSIHIITDSAADFSSGELKQYQIGVIPLSVTFGTDAYLDGVTLTQDVFWKRLFAGENPKTSQPSPEMFLSAFEEAKAAGDSVVCICVSSALSGTAQSASIAADMAEGSDIHIVDSMSVATAQKILALHACRLRDEGVLSAAQIAEELRRLVPRIRLYACLDTLEYLARGGRIPPAAASLGSLVHLKPLITITEDGKVGMAGKGMGLHRATASLIKLAAEHEIDESFPILPFFTYEPDNCFQMIKKLNAAGITCAEEDAVPIGATISAHAGPRAFGLVFVEKA